MAILIAGAIPVVGGTLGVIVLLGGTIGEFVVWQRTNTAQKALEAPTTARQLQAPPSGPSPAAEYTVQQIPPHPPAAALSPRAPMPKPPAVRRTKPRRPDLSEIIAQLEVDETVRELDEQVEVAGETYYSRQIKAVFRGAETVIASTGSTLRSIGCLLVPDPWNEHDENAVAVFIGGQQVGHLPAELAEDYALPLRQIAERGLLVSGQARIWAKDDDGMIRARVTLLIPSVLDL